MVDWRLVGWIAGFGNFLNFFTLTEVTKDLYIPIKFYK